MFCRNFVTLLPTSVSGVQMPQKYEGQVPFQARAAATGKARSHIIRVLITGQRLSAGHH